MPSLGGNPPIEVNAAAGPVLFVEPPGTPTLSVGVVYVPVDDFQGVAQETTLDAVLAALAPLAGVADHATLLAIAQSLAGTLTVHVDNPTGATDVSALAKDATLTANKASVDAVKASVDANRATLGAPAQDASVVAVATLLAQLVGAVAKDITNQAIQTAVTELAHDAFAFPPRALQYSRAIDDSMRVTLQAGGQVGAAVYWGATNVYPPYYGTGAPMSMDARDQQRELAMQTFQQVRNGRWVFS